MNSRRSALASIAALFLATISSHAQPPGVFRIAGLSEGLAETTAQFIADLKNALRDQGYVEGKPFIRELRFTGGNRANLPTLARELVGLRPDVIIGVGSRAVLATMDATSTIPIVMFGIADPVGVRLVASLARPGGNVTGASSMAHDVKTKNLEFLRAVAPGAKSLAILGGDTGIAYYDATAGEFYAKAKSLGLTVLTWSATSPEALEKAFASAAKDKVGALMVLASPAASLYRNMIIEFAAKAKLPAIYPSSPFAERGELMSYGASRPEQIRFCASCIDKILRGAKSADLPVQQPTEFELVINMKTAKALAITIPREILLRDDKVIE